MTHSPAPRPPIVALAGPTAAGKTAAALALAEALPCARAARVDGALGDNDIGAVEIVSCDSVAVYRGCDVGAAKPTPEERARVPHHLVDIADPDEQITAARWAALADEAIDAIAARGHTPLVVGGTGLYLHALVDGLFDAPPADASFRAALREEAARLGWPALHARLATVDPVAAARIAPSDPVRIERALEVHHLTGEPISTLQARHRGAPPRYPTLTLLLDPGPALEARIAARARAMLAAGLLDETRRLVDRYGPHLKVLGAVGYKEALAHLNGQLPASQLEEAIRVATRRYARRQRTWFARYEAGRSRTIAGAADLPVGDVRDFILRSRGERP